MRPDELIKALSDGTTMQKEERLKGLVGSDVEIVATIWNVEHDVIRLGGLHSSCSLIEFDEERFSNALLSYSRGDDVTVTARLKSAVFSPDLHFTLDLIAISKTGTTFQSRMDGAKNARASKSSCFIATACYGDRESPEVVLLQHFRDKVLSRSSIGRALVIVYCAVSPPIAAVLFQCAPLRAVVRTFCVQPAVALVRWALVENRQT